MTTFPQRVIEAYERTESPLLGRALEAAKIAPVEPGGPMRLPSGLDPARYAAPFHTHSLAWCLLMELRKHAYPLHLFNAIDYLADDDAPDRILAACIEAGRSEAWDAT